MNNIQILEQRGVSTSLLRVGRRSAIFDASRNVSTFFDRRLRGDALISVGLGRTAAMLALSGRYNRRVGWLINHTPGLPHIRNVGVLMKAFNVVGAISPASLAEVHACPNVGVRSSALWLPQFTTFPGEQSILNKLASNAASAPLPSRVGFLGNLKAEKGVGLLLEAWRRIQNLPELLVLGDGPMRSDVLAASSGNAASQVTYLGSFDASGRSRALSNFFTRIGRLLVPSITHGEGMPTVILEALRHGVPVMASRLGGTIAMGIPPIAADRRVCALVAIEDFVMEVKHSHESGVHPSTIRSECVSLYDRFFGPDPVMDRWRQALGLAPAE